jgi:hypothetical protein
MNTHITYPYEHIRKTIDLILRFMKLVTKNVSLSMGTSPPTERLINRKYSTYVKSRIWTGLVPLKSESSRHGQRGLGPIPQPRCLIGRTKAQAGVLLMLFQASCDDQHLKRRKASSCSNRVLLTLRKQTKFNPWKQMPDAFTPQSSTIQCSTDNRGRTQGVPLRGCPMINMV